MVLLPLKYTVKLSPNLVQYCIYVYHGIGVEPEELDLACHRLQVLVLLDHGDARQAAVMLHREFSDHLTRVDGRRSMCDAAIQRNKKFSL